MKTKINYFAKKFDLITSDRDYDSISQRNFVGATFTLTILAIYLYFIISLITEFIEGQKSPIINMIQIPKKNQQLDFVQQNQNKIEFSLLNSNTGNTFSQKEIIQNLNISIERIKKNDTYQDKQFLQIQQGQKTSIEVQETNLGIEQGTLTSQIYISISLRPENIEQSIQFLENCYLSIPTKQITIDDFDSNNETVMKTYHKLYLTNNTYQTLDLQYLTGNITKQQGSLFSIKTRILNQPWDILQVKQQYDINTAIKNKVTDDVNRRAMIHLYLNKNVQQIFIIYPSFVTLLAQIFGTVAFVKVFVLLYNYVCHYILKKKYKEMIYHQLFTNQQNQEEAEEDQKQQQQFSNHQISLVYNDTQEKKERNGSDVSIELKQKFNINKAQQEQISDVRNNSTQLEANAYNKQKTDILINVKNNARDQDVQNAQNVLYDQYRKIKNTQMIKQVFYFDDYLNKNNLKFQQQIIQ